MLFHGNNDKDIQENSTLYVAGTATFHVLTHFTFTATLYYNLGTIIALILWVKKPRRSQPALRALISITQPLQLISTSLYQHSMWEFKEQAKTFPTSILGAHKFPSWVSSLAGMFSSPAHLDVTPFKTFMVLKQKLFNRQGRLY